MESNLRRCHTLEPEHRLRRSCERLVSHCADLRDEDRALVISNPETRILGELISDAARFISCRIDHLIIPPLTMHGQEPPDEVAKAMLESDAIFALTRYSMAHSKARSNASRRGARYLSLPDYSEAILLSQAMLADFRGLTTAADKLAAVLSDGDEVRLSTPKGTNLVCSIKGRLGNPAPGWCRGPGTMASPPDAETNIAVLEDGSNGEVIVDGSIPCPDIGLLDEPIRLKIRGGRVIDVSGSYSGKLKQRYDMLGDARTRIVAELGIGLNPLAKLNGTMLEDEGCLGTVHLGMGSNATIGGENEVPFHLDHVIRDARVDVDGKPIDIKSFIQ